MSIFYQVDQSKIILTLPVRQRAVLLFIVFLVQKAFINKWEFTVRDVRPLFYWAFITSEIRQSSLVV